MAYPASIASFNFKRNNIDKVVADDVNSAYTEIMAIEKQLGGVNDGNGITMSSWGTSTFSTSISNWYSNDGLAARLKNIEAGLYKILGSDNTSKADKLTTSITVNGTAGVDWSSSGSPYTFTAAAGTLTGTILASGVTASSLTSVATLTNLVIGASSGTTAPLKLTSGTNLGTAQAGALEYDGKALYYTTSTNTGRGVVAATNYYTYYGNSSYLGGINSPYGFKMMTVEPYTAYDYEGMYIFSFNENNSTSSYPIFKIEAGTGTGATIANAAFTVTWWCTTNGSFTSTSGRTINEVYAVGNTSITLENTTVNTIVRYGILRWKGILRNEQASAGTVIARIYPSALGTNVMIKDGSYIKLTPIGVNTVDKVGAWS